MKLKKIIIKNYKPIGNLEFDIKKFGISHTVAFVGINEVGKSNILEAMSFLSVPEEEFDFLDVCNQNNDQAEYVDLYFEMEFENPDTYKNILREVLIAPKKFMKSLEIEKVIKHVYLKRNENKFGHLYKISFGKMELNNLFFKKTDEDVVYKGTDKSFKKYEFKELRNLSNEDKDEFEKLDLENLEKILVEFLFDCFVQHETKVSFWEPSDQYLITKGINLNEFKEDPTINIPLKNIFSLSNYISEDSIKTKIEEAERNDRSLRRLEKQLSSNTTKYINGIWKEHKIKVDVRITDQMTCRIHIKDKGRRNEDNYYAMNSRSQGFKQFISLILTLSIQNEKLGMKNRLILVDEPENHLHPSGVRDMRDELIRIGKENYVFLSTHSNFMIDNKTMERNIIIKKDTNNNTFKKIINNYNDLFDDEVLKDAFGINVFKDFLTANKILVEGFSDKLILQKAISKCYPSFNFAITNGKGDNLPSVASLLNFQSVSPIVILDDDRRGQENKKNILRIRGVFSNSNVFTIRDLEGGIINNGTIEDLLPKEFVISRFKEIYKRIIRENADLEEIGNFPIIERLRRFLVKKLGTEKKKEIKKILEELKRKLSEDYNPSRIEENTPLLYSLIEKIIAKLE